MKDIIFSNNSSGLTLTKNELKAITKVNKSLENRGSFLKRITEKRSRHEGELLSFPCPPMKMVYY